MAETQVVTVAFTDLVGSTELSSRLDPNVADQLRKEHFALLRGAIEAHHGTEVKNLGDGLMVVFPIASSALNCAEAMQQAIDRYNRRAREPFSIRVCLSHGEVTEDNRDYFGDPVIEAARLCAMAQGGQILASQVVRLTAGRRASQEFVSVGELKLKGLPEPVAAVEVCWLPAVDRGSGISLPARVETSQPALGFVGREQELAILAEELKEADVQRRRRIALIGGEPGIGKTTLATTFARQAHDRSAVVLYGRCDEDIRIPYQPWVEAMAHLLDQAPSGLLDEVLAARGADLSRLGPALLGLGDGGGSSDPETARYLLFGAVAAVLQAAARDNPVVLILDDLQWADVPSLQLLRYLVSSDQPLAVLVVGTFRESEVATSAALADLLARLHRQEGVARVSLRGLGDDELLDLMESAAGHAMGEAGLGLRDALGRETDGNPFFVGELLRHLAETNVITQDTDGRWSLVGSLRDHALPVSVREVIGERVARLGAEAERVLSLAAVVGRDFDLEVLALVSEISEDALLDVLDAAVEATLITDVSGNRYSFAHALVEHALYDALTGARTTRAHRRVAQAIEQICSDEPGARVGELAHHWTQAATAPEQLQKALHYAQAAGDEALARLAPDEALRWYTQALALPLSAEDLRSRLLIGLGNAQRQTGDPAFRQTLLDAAHLAQDLRADDLLVTAALANTRGVWSSTGVVDAERVAVLEAACDVLAGTHSAEHARVLAQLAVELTFDGDFSRRRSLVDQALRIARTVGDPATLVRVINASVHAIDVPETLAERRSLGVEAAATAQHIGDPLLEFYCADACCHAQYQAGDVAEGDASLSVQSGIAERLGQPSLRFSAANRRSARAMLAGDVEEAERLALQSAELGNATGQPDGIAVFAAQFGAVRTMQGRAEELVDTAGRVAAKNPGIPGFSIFLAQLYCDIDRPDDARTALEPFVGDAFAGVGPNLTWLSSMGIAAYAVAELGWVEAAEILFERLRPFAGQIAWVGTVCGSGVSYYLGRLAATLGRADDAEAYFAESAEAHDRIGASWSLAMTQLAWGRLLVTRGDLARGSVLLEKALDSSRERGYGLVERRASHALEALGAG